MVTFRGVHPVALAAAVIFAVLNSSCNNGSFTGGGKKIEKTEAPSEKPQAKPEKKPTPEKTEELGQDKESEQTGVKPQSDSTNTDSNNNEVITPTVTNEVVVPETDTDVVTTTTNTDTPDTTTDVTTTPPVTSNPETDGSVASLQVPVTCFVNMEHGYHGTDENYIVQLTDGSGSVVAAGYSTIDAVRNGTPTDGQGAYPGMILDFDLTWLKDPRMTSGSGKLNVCYSDPNLSPEKGSCQSKASNVGGDGERPTAIVGAPAQWSVSENGGKPQIKVSGNYNLSTHHPVWGLAKAGGCFKDYQSPLVLDLNKNKKYDLVDVWNDNKQIRFDINADGKKVRTGWVAASDAFLALDLNGNGLIDDGLELFGEYTKGTRPVAKGERTFDNGFQALAQYDSNQDGKINKMDAVFAKLLIWRDINQDGTCQKDEVSSLGAHKIAEFSLAYTKLGNLAPAIVENNEVRLEATYKLENGDVHLISDVWFKQRRYSDKMAVK